MEIRDRAFLKEWFKKGKYPKQEHFWDWLESFWHKEEDSIPVDNIEGLADTLNNKYEKSAGETLEDRMDEAEKRLGNYDGSIKDTGDILNEHTETLLEHGARLDDHKERLEKYGERLDGHDEDLQKHTEILDANAEKFIEQANRLDITEQSLKDFSVTGEGNAITTIEHAEDGLTLVAKKENTFVDLESEQTIIARKDFTSGSLHLSSHFYRFLRDDVCYDHYYPMGKVGILNSKGILRVSTDHAPGYREFILSGEGYAQWAGDFYPSINKIYNLGSISQQWRTIYSGDGNFSGSLYAIDNIITGNKTSSIDGIAGVIVSNTGIIHITSNNLPAIYFYASNATTRSGFINCSIGDNVSTGNNINTDCHLLPALTNSQNIGSPGLYWKDLYATTATFTNRPKVSGVEVALTSDTTYLKDFSTTGSGNAVTSIERSEDGLSLTATKGNTFVDIASSQTITGTKTFTSFIYPARIYQGIGKNAVSDGITGAILNDGGIFLCGSTPQIEFYHNNSTEQTGYIRHTNTKEFTIRGNILPNATASWNIGSATLRYNNFYSNHLRADTTVFVGTRTSATDATIGNILTSNGFIYTSNTIYTGVGKSSYNDGVTGVGVLQGGSIHITAVGNPYIRFYQNAATGSGSIDIQCIGANRLRVTGEITPDTDKVRNLGSTSNRWYRNYSTILYTGERTAYNDGLTGAVFAENGNLYNSGPIVIGTGKTSGEDGKTGMILEKGGNIRLVSSADSGLYFYRNNGTANTGYIINNGNFQLATNTNFLPAANNNYNLGAINNRWNHVYTGTVYTGEKTSSSDIFSGVMIGSNGSIYASGIINAGVGKTVGNEVTGITLNGTTGNISLTSTGSPTIYFNRANATSTTGYFQNDADKHISTDSHFRPLASAAGTINLGTSDRMWNALYATTAQFGKKNGLNSTETGILINGTSGTIASSSNIHTGVAKTGGSDGKTGLFLGANGNIGMTSDTTPGIYFYRTNSTSTTASILNIDTKKLQFEAHIYPSVSNTYDVGSASIYWRNMYVNNINTKGSVFAGFNLYTGGKTSMTDGNPGCGLNNAGQVHLTGYTDTNGTVYHPGVSFYYNNATTSSAYIRCSGDVLLGIKGSFVPVNNNIYNLGSSSLCWKDIYAYTGNLDYLTTRSSTQGTLSVNCSLAPGMGNKEFSLGAKERIWNELWVTAPRFSQLLAIASNKISVLCSLIPSGSSCSLGENSGSNRWTIYANTVNYTALNNSSDIRLKNIQSQFTTSILSKIDDLSLFYFTRKEENPDKVYLGISAQEIKQLIPEVVTEDERGYLGVDYANLATVIAIQSAKELKAKIRLLEEEVLEMKAQLNSLSA